MSEAKLTKTELTTIHRLAERGTYSREAIDAILDEGFVCHVGFTVDGEARVIPTTYGRRGDVLYFHGATASGLHQALGAGVRASVCVTLIDGIVLGRSAFHQALNFRSVVLYGRATEITDSAAKMEALRALVEHVIPGRWADVRPPSEEELRFVHVLSFPIEEGSAKVRSGPPADLAEDLELACWAGVIPTVLQPQLPVAAPDLKPGIAVPKYVARYRRPGTPK